MTITLPHPTTLASQHLPLRPDHGGKAGRACTVVSNFFPLTINPNAQFHHYDVELIPNVPPKVTKLILMACIKKHWSAPGSPRAVHDGRANLFTNRALFNGDFNTIEFDFLEEGRSAEHPQSFRIKLSLVARLGIEEISRFLQGKGDLNTTTAIQAMDIALRFQSQYRFLHAGKSIFAIPEANPLSGGIHVRQGIYQSVRPARGRLLLNADIASRAFYQDGPLIPLLASVLNFRNPNQWTTMNEHQRRILTPYVRGLRIHVTHRGKDFQPRYSLAGLSKTGADTTSFSLREGGTTTVAAYFHKTYNVRLAHPRLPCVMSSKGIFFPLEVCVVDPGQSYRRKLNPDQTAEMIKHTAVRPDTRQQRILQGLRTLTHRTNPDLKAFGMSVAEDMVKIRARVLPQPKLQYHASSKIPKIDPKFGAWNLRDLRVLTGIPLRSWAVISFIPEKMLPRPQLVNFIRELVIVLSDTGVPVQTREPPISYASPQSDLKLALSQAFMSAGNQTKVTPQIILCLLPDASVPLYAEIKRICEVDIGIPSQCCISKHLYRPNKQYCANVTLKINAKIGGVNHDFAPGSGAFYNAAPTLVMGADVIHPEPGNRTQPSIVAVVSSTRKTPTRFHTQERAQESRMEIIADLQDMTTASLKAFYAGAKAKPARILFFRDGVGEGMFQEVLRTEVPAIKRACATLGPGYNPSLVFVVVQKRHHARFFPTSPDTRDRSGNCLPGTTVDTDITHPSQYDFYIQSHPGLQGTSRPTHYHVLLDELRLGSDILQQIINEQCYVYARATRAVSIVPAVYYADLAAARARYHMSGSGWSDTMSEVSSTSAEHSTLSPLKPTLHGSMYYM